ncbi:hypothetical protein GGS23DRAFT_597336 [Durotheca rogersii]|uniref:uncharacterized protein n=1 Tax=Durotheca rogersii TaxID=419775 RepID=UPI002220AD50|nr:uncharacterized protein GGS23DRAFT_597336 [Durotheca rogersii]KAI5862535.1 hypothetical protein GGS23DRAFT_597336 [Durotheca rogersii]
METTPWLIAVVVIGAAIAVTLVLLLVMYLIRRKRRLAQEKGQDPLGRKGLKKHKMTPMDQRAAEEAERTTMIRKSLASRNSLSTNNSRGPTPELPSEDFYQAEAGEREPMAPRNGDQWKEWEATAQSRYSIASHFRDVDLGVHPALLPQPQLAVLEPLRGTSPTGRT